MKHSESKVLSPFTIYAFALLVLIAQSCATTQPPPVDPSAYRERSRSSVNGDVKVTVAVPTTAEAEAVYGVKLKGKFIQPVWIEVKNGSAKTYWFLPSGMDPNYFSPSEAAFAFHTGSKETNRQIDDKFINLQFQNPVRPGSSESGFVLTNLDEGFKAVDIDLISRDDAKRKLDSRIHRRVACHRQEPGLHDVF